jgi:hypothetical protein
MNEQPLNTPNSADAGSLRARPEELASIYRNISRLLAERGFGALELQKILSRVQAQCTLCGFAVTGEQIGSWAVLDPETRPEDPVLDRLRLGYCGRVGCDSWYYVLRAEPCDGINWADNFAKAQRTERPKHRSWSILTLLLPRFQARTWGSIALGLAVILSCLVIRYRSQGGRIPLLEPKHEYRLKPSGTV